MADILVLLPKSYSREETIALQSRAGIRAVAYGDLGGGTGGIVFVRTDSLSSGSDLSDLICPGQSPESCVQGVLQPLPSIPSVHEPAEFNFFAVLTLRGGRQRHFKRHLLGFGEAPEGVRDARALVFGMERVHALVEVVGDDLDAVSERLLELVDHDDVAEVRTFVCGPESTAGFGAAATMRKPSQKKIGASRKSRG